MSGAPGHVHAAVGHALSLASLALLATWLDRGKGLLAAVVALSALVLSHLVYAYMTGISALFLLLWACGRAMRASGCCASPRPGRPLRWSPAYFCCLSAVEAVPVASPYLERGSTTPSALRGAAQAADRHLFDHSRLPVVTALVLAGFVTALLARTREGCLPRACSSSGSRCTSARYLGALADCCRCTTA